MAAALLAVHAFLLGWGAWRHSPVKDEIGHLPAGISHWLPGRFGRMGQRGQSSRFDLYRVNPPLVRMIASLPVLCAGPTIDDGMYGTSIRTERPAFEIGERFVAANGQRSFWLFTLARWACIPLSLLGAGICFQWGRDLYGNSAGIAAMALWCFSPAILAWGQTITPDVGAAALWLTAMYCFWRWLRAPSQRRMMASGLLLGVALLAKSTWIIAFGLWPLIWAFWILPGRNVRSEQVRATKAGQMAVILLLALLVLNVGYGCEGSFKRLGDYDFVSRTLGSVVQESAVPDTAINRGNRFRDSWLGYVPVPLPKNFLAGIDYQKMDFENEYWSYLRGEWRLGGWWYYYLYGLAVRVPLGTWLLVGMALAVSLFRREYNSTWRDELVLLLPPAVIVTLASSQTGFSHHLRYVLSALPFVFIWASKVAQAVDLRHWKIASLAAIALVWSVTSSLWVYPHSLSYFNELAGGPTGGHAHLLNSNIDWGQDLLYLKRWLDKHPAAKPLHLAYSNCYDASLAGIEYTLPPTEPQPGWHALSVNEIRNRSGEYKYFLSFKPVGKAGYSIYIYHITLDEANRVRRELGMRELPEDWQPPEGNDDG